jgi:putative ABC transport system permease protein
VTAASSTGQRLRLLGRLLAQVSWPEWRHHPWRNAAALVAVVLGVALAFSVQLINQSALAEFGSAVRAVNGEPDFELRSGSAGFDEALYGRVANDPGVAIASPVIELDSYALDAPGEPGGRIALKVIGIDVLVAAPLAPKLVPRPAAGADRMAVFDPGAVFLNAAARRALPGAALRVQTEAGSTTLRIAGSVAAGGAALAVMDIAGVQRVFGRRGRVGRIDVRLVPGADRAAVLARLALPAGIRAAAPDEAAQRLSNVSRAYRVNLTVLALVALFTGAFLVFSILSLSVAKRQPQFALLGVLGASAGERLALVLAESALLGAAGSAIGLLLGTGLAALALRLLAGDLGGGYFPGVAPTLQWSPAAAAVYGALGVVAALVGGWFPARAAQRLAPAQGLKGLAADDGRVGPAWVGPLLLAAGVALALLPPLGGIPLAAYVSVACLLVGGIACVPATTGLLLRAVPPPRRALPLLAVERARHQRKTATIAVAGVVASLSLAVALTVMVASFRTSVTEWLDSVLPADLYARAGSSLVAGDVVTLPAELPRRALGIAGVERAEAQRVVRLQLDPAQPAVVLIARPLADPARDLPLVGELLPAPANASDAAAGSAAPPTAVYVSEAMVALYRAAPGTTLVLPLASGPATVFVRGVWRDYARQFGAVTIADADYRRLTGDARVNDLALWLAPGARTTAVQAALRTLATQLGTDGALLEFAAAGEIRTLSLRIFDRSFAVTYWLQGVAIAIGLFGIAASFSAQVLARRKEFGLLSHLGLTRRQILAVVATEGAVWTAVGALLGLALGLAVAVVLVEVVNPQSFHWTMRLLLPWGRLGLLCAAVVVAGTATAWLAARRAAGREMALAVKEDW